jgi:hypothetical protein
MLRGITVAWLWAGLAGVFPPSFAQVCATAAVKLSQLELQRVSARSQHQVRVAIAPPCVCFVSNQHKRHFNNNNKKTAFQQQCSWIESLE